MYIFLTITPPHMVITVYNQFNPMIYSAVYVLENSFFLKVNFRKINFKKINYFLMFGSIMKNKLENIFQCLVMSWKIS